MSEAKKSLSDEVREILSRPMAPVTLVGRVFYGLSPDASRRAAHRGDIECKQVGGRLFALTKPLRELV
jgi:hypothetical protein